MGKNEGTGSQGRILWLDVLKGILVFFVVLSHSNAPQPYRNFFTPFFLTMFFAASGYTFSFKRGFVEFCRVRAGQVLVPFLCFGLIRVFLLHLLQKGEMGLGERMLRFLLQRSHRNDEMWFLSCMFVVSVVFYLMAMHVYRRENAGGLLVITGVISTLGFVDMAYFQVRLVWEGEIAAFMLLFTALGFLYKRYEERLSGKIGKTITLVLGMLYLMAVFLMPNTADINVESFEKPLFFYMTTWMAFLPAVGVAKRLSVSNMRLVKMIRPCLIFLGRNSIFYYAFGGFFRIVFFALLEKGGEKLHFLTEGWGLFLSAPVCAVGALVLLACPAYLTSRFLPWMVGKKRLKL